jgi:hypothetical protein
MTARQKLQTYDYFLSCYAKNRKRKKQSVLIFLFVPSDPVIGHGIMAGDIAH